MIFDEAATITRWTLVSMAVTFEYLFFRRRAYETENWLRSKATKMESSQKSSIRVPGIYRGTNPLEMRRLKLFVCERQVQHFLTGKICHGTVIQRKKTFGKDKSMNLNFEKGA